MSTFSPAENSVTLGDGDKISYEHLAVVPGIKIHYDSIEGLSEALANPESLVSTIYGYKTYDKVSHDPEISEGQRDFHSTCGCRQVCRGTPKGDVTRFGLLEASRLI